MAIHLTKRLLRATSARLPSMGPSRQDIWRVSGGTKVNRQYVKCKGGPPLSRRDLFLWQLLRSLPNKATARTDAVCASGGTKPRYVKCKGAHISHEETIIHGPSCHTMLVRTMANSRALQLELQYIKSKCASTSLYVKYKATVKPTYDPRCNDLSVMTTTFHCVCDFPTLPIQTTIRYRTFSTAPYCYNKHFKTGAVKKEHTRSSKARQCARPLHSNSNKDTTARRVNAARGFYKTQLKATRF